MALKVFVDFDGTITRADVGNAFFLTFGGPVCEKIVEEYQSGKITAQECFRRELAEIGTIDRRALDAFIERQEIDAAFPRFVRFCGVHGISCEIVSDGLDYYIRRILTAHGVGDVPFVSNILHLTPPDAGGRSVPTLEFPYPDTECGTCACCKRNIIVTRAGEDDVIAYVGEGFSDQCPVRYADIVFAKDALQTYCQRENISYFLYRTFDDVVIRMEELLTRKRIRKRRSAEARRRELFISEP